LALNNLPQNHVLNVLTVALTAFFHIPQISVEELRLAMTFLKEQMGEEELVAMLEQLRAEGSSTAGVNVAKLMQLAMPNERQDEDSD